MRALLVAALALSASVAWADTKKGGAFDDVIDDAPKGKTAKPKKADPKKPEPKKAEPKAEPKKAEPKPEPKKAEKKAEPKKADKKADKKKKPVEEEVEIDMDPPAPPPAPPPKVEPLDEPASPKSDGDVAVVKVAPKRDTGAKRLHVRAGVALVEPLSSSKELTLADVNGPASLAVQNGPIAGSGASVSSAATPAAILGYDLTPKIAIETVIGLPFTVKFQATGTLASMSLAPTALGIPTGVPPLGPQLGEAKAAPPVVTLTYSPIRGRARPYVGAGAAVLFATGAKVTNPTLTEVAQPDMHISPAPGLVLQSGLDVSITKRVYARIDVKFIALMQANATVEHIQVKTPDLPLFDTVEVGTAKMSVMVNPLIIQAGIGTDF